MSFHLYSQDYKNSELSTESRVEHLMSQMTLEEKVAQLQTVWQAGKSLADSSNQFDAAQAKALIPLGIGHFGRPSEGMSPIQTVEYTNAIQRWLIHHTRLGIPAIFHEEALHGHAASKSTSYPQAIALASMWDPELLKQMYSATAKEVRARGGNQALTPILDIARDPRWGRIEETFGEDTYLTTALGVAAIQGFQGTSPTIGSEHVMSTLKHLTGHGQPTAGLNIAPAPMGERELREIFLPPFEAAIKLGNARSVMASYNEIDGVPSHANKFLLNTVLRDEWQFDGTVVSDYFAIEELVSRHGIAANLSDAAVVALNAGVDIEMPDIKAFATLKDLVKQGKLSTNRINTSVKRILTDKFNMGLFDNPYTDPEGLSIINSEAHRALALKTAEKAIVLLKNSGTLPLALGEHKNIAVIGPHADETLLGGYSDIPAQTVTILDGIKHKARGIASVNYAPGTVITMAVEAPSDESIVAKTFSKQRWNQDVTALAEDADHPAMIAEAVVLAKQSDVVVLVVGGNEGTSREGWSENHLGDRSTLDLAGHQQQLVEEVLAVGKPTVIILSNGRPLTLSDKIHQQSTAIIEAWYLGQETGTAVANVLFGDTNPGGKLPVTFPRKVGQVPMFYNHKTSARRGYVFSESTPQYSFGHGLSYTSFEYSDLKVEDENAHANGEIMLSFSVKNTGSYTGDEVTQLYIRDPVASTTRPIKELKAFKRVTLAPNQSVRVHFTLPVNMLAYFDLDMNYVVDAGEIMLMIGSASDDIRLQHTTSIKGDTYQITPANKVFLSKSWTSKL